MFGPLTNFSKRKNYILPLVLVLCPRCLCTSAVFVITPKQIVAGTDRLSIELSIAGTPINKGTATKIALLQGRFIVAYVGVQTLRYSPSPAEQQAVVYDFPKWIKGIESQVNSDTSVFQLVEILEKETARTFTDAAPVEKMMDHGKIKCSESVQNLFVQYIVAGYINRIPTVIRVYYEFDWRGNHLIGPLRRTEFPNTGRSLIGVYVAGRSQCYPRQLKPE